MDVIASAITIASSALTLTITVTRIIHDIKRWDENVQELETKSEILRETIQEVQKTYNIREERRASLETTPLDENEIRILKTVKRIVECCNNDLGRFEKKLSKLLGSRYQQNLILRTWREQIARPTFKKIVDSIDRHHGSLQLLVSLHQGYIIDARFAAILESQIKVLEGINEIKAKLSAQPAQLTRIDSEGTLVETSPYIEHEDAIESSDEGETLLDNEDSLRRSHSPQTSSENGKLLLRAVKDGAIDVLESLLSKSDANLEETDEKGRTPLILAADLGKAHIINRLLISQLVETNATDKLGRTALHYCAQMKMNKTIEMLLDHGADVNIQDRGTHPPMYYAIGDDDYDTVKMLLDHNASTDFKLPTKLIPKSITSLIDKYNATGSTDPVLEPKETKSKKSISNSFGGLTGTRKSSIIRPWSSTER